MYSLKFEEVGEEVHPGELEEGQLAVVTRHDCCDEELGGLVLLTADGNLFNLSQCSAYSNLAEDMADWFRVRPLAPGATVTLRQGQA